MNETLQIVINGYGLISREFWGFISTDPELEQPHGEFAQKRRGETPSKIMIPDKQEEKRPALISPVLRGRRCVSRRLSGFEGRPPGCSSNTKSKKWGEIIHHENRNRSK